MPNSLEAALAFSLIVVPGYQIVRGYALARGADAPDRDLYVLAQAVVASLVWIALTWPLLAQLVGWIQSDELSDHWLAVYGISPLVIGLPWFAGVLCGNLVNRFANPLAPEATPWLGTGLASIDLTARASGWDRVWMPAVTAGRALVTVDTDNGESFVGQFAANSFVSLSPAVPAVYFERAYRVDEEGALVTYPGGAFVEGARIVSIKFNQIG